MQTIFTPCVAFRVAGMPIKHINSKSNHARIIIVPTYFGILLLILVCYNASHTCWHGSRYPTVQITLYTSCDEDFSNGCLLIKDIF